MSCTNFKKQTCIIVASIVGNVNIRTVSAFLLPPVNLLLKHGAKVEDRDSKGLTSVHYAALNGKINVLSFLTSRGAKLDVRDNKGETPLMAAAEENQLIVGVACYHSQ